MKDASSHTIFKYKSTNKKSIKEKSLMKFMWNEKFKHLRISSVIHLDR